MPLMQFLNSMFLSLLKQAFMGRKGADAKANISLVLIIYSAPSIVCYAPEADFLRGSDKYFGNSFFDEKNPGHASISI